MAVLLVAVVIDRTVSALTNIDAGTHNSLLAINRPSLLGTSVSVWSAVIGGNEVSRDVSSQMKDASARWVNSMLLRWRREARRDAIEDWSSEVNLVKKGG